MSAPEETVPPAPGLPATTTSQPTNSLPLAIILKYISSHPSTLTTRQLQNDFLARLTKKHKFPYYSSTYGHTHHDTKSLRAVLVATVRNHATNQASEEIKKEEGSSEGKPEGKMGKAKKQLEALFRDGEKALDSAYVESVMLALAPKSVTEIDGMLKGLEPEYESSLSESSDADDELFQGLPGEHELSSDSNDEDYEPNERAAEGRTKWARALGGKRKHDVLVEDGRKGERKEGGSVRKKPRIEERPQTSGAANHRYDTGTARRTGTARPASVASNASKYATMGKPGLPASALERLALNPPASMKRWEGQRQEVKPKRPRQPQRREELQSTKYPDRPNLREMEHTNRRPSAPAARHPGHDQRRTHEHVHRSTQSHRPSPQQDSDIRISEADLQRCFETMAVKVSCAMRGFMEDVQKARRR